MYLSDEEVIDHSSDEDDNFIPPPRQPRTFRQRINFDPFSFQSRFRLNGAQMEHLMVAISNNLN
jgi:hypothetical protein